MGTVAPQKKTDRCQVFCSKNGRYYSSKSRMKASLNASRTCKGKKIKYGRKRRSLVNGRMYVNRTRMNAALKDSERQLANPENTKMLQEFAKDHGLPERVAKRVESNRKHRKTVSKAVKRYLAREDVKAFHKWNIERTPGMRGWSTENGAELSHKLKTHRNGKQVIQFIDCEREKSVGVVQG